MAQTYFGEKWKPVKFDFEFTNEFRIEISNMGRIRTFNKISDGKIVKGSMVNGYRIIRLKLYTPRDEKNQKRLDLLQQQVYKLARKLKSLKDNNESKKTIREAEDLLDTLKKSLSNKFLKNLKERTIHYQSLIHRLVAVYYLRKPPVRQIVVAHLDYDKMNNRASNLKWMTLEENYAHQKFSPYVIAEKSERRKRRKEHSNATKLTVTKVMLLKKMLNQGKPIPQLVRLFKITDTQIYRIKRGENWADIDAAK